MLKIKDIVYQSESTLCFYFGELIETQLALEIATFAESIRLNIDGIIEAIPSYTSLLLEFNVLKTNTQTLEHQVTELLSNFKYKRNASEHLELPIYYHPEVAPDLIHLAKTNDLTVDQVVQIHSETNYTVTSLGFAPGFAYLAGLDPRIATPRLNTPKNVPKGSLGIADNQTAIYPNTSPGGWSIIGNCPVTLFDLTANPITPFVIGMTVKFTPVTKDIFIKKGGLL